MISPLPLPTCHELSYIIGSLGDVGESWDRQNRVDEQLGLLARLANVVQESHCL